MILDASRFAGLTRMTGKYIYIYYMGWLQVDTVIFIFAFSNPIPFKREEICLTACSFALESIPSSQAVFVSKFSACVRMVVSRSLFSLVNTPVLRLLTRDFVLSSRVTRTWEGGSWISIFFPLSKWLFRVGLILLSAVRLRVDWGFYW